MLKSLNFFSVKADLMCLVIQVIRKRCYRKYHPKGEKILQGYSVRDGPKPKIIPDQRSLGVLCCLLSVQFRLKFCQPLLSERIDRVCLQSCPYLSLLSAFILFPCFSY